MAKATCWIELRYGWGLKGVAIAQTGNPAILRQVKQVILAEAKRKTEISRQVDTTLGFIQEQEYTKLQQILDTVMPEDGSS